MGNPRTGIDGRSEYLDKIIREVERDLYDKVADIDHDVSNYESGDSEIHLRVKFLDGSSYVFTFEDWRLTMRPSYMTSDVDIIVNEITKYMKDNGIVDLDPIDYWEEIASKEVQDFDGFWTDYTLYYNESEGRFVCIFGDKDMYNPTNTDPDFECEEKWEAFEWFNDYDTGEAEGEDDTIYESTNIEVAGEADTTPMNATGVIEWMEEHFPECPYVHFRYYFEEPVVKLFFDKSNASIYKIHGILDKSGLKYRAYGPYIVIYTDEDEEFIKNHDDEIQASRTIECQKDDSSMNATDVVRWMYEEYPQINFYDERDLGDKVRLIFELPSKPGLIEDIKESLDSLHLEYVLKPYRLYITAPEDPEYKIEDTDSVESSTNLADAFIRVHDKDEINWQMQDYNYDPFYDELKEYMVDGETWDDEDDEGYPADTNVDLKTLFARMPEDKQRDFLDRFWIHNNSKDYVKSDWNIEDQIDAPNTIGKLNPGDKFVNRNGVEITIVDPSKDGRVQYTVGDECRIGSEKLIQQMLYRNNYMRKVESSSEIIDMGLGDDVEYWYFTTHGVQPGSVPKGLIIDQIIDTPEGTYFSTNRVITTESLKYYDIKERAPR